MSIPPQRLVISSISQGMVTYQKPFLIDNVAFPTIENALCWRKQLIKKPGSFQLGRLQRQIGTTGSPPFNILPIPIQPGVSQFIIGSVVLSDSTITAGGDPVTLTSSDPTYSGTLNRATGLLTLVTPVIPATPIYYVPGLPVMGIEEFESDKLATTQIDFPQNVYFDTVYSYVFNGLIFTDNSFYKTTGLPVTWSGQDYQQFDSTNYYRAMWVTNNNPGAQFVAITNIAPGATTTFTVTAFNPVLANGTTFQVYLSEFGGASAALVNGLSFTATVTGPTTFTIPILTAALTGGAIQYLTANSPNGFGDGIRWYDGQGPGALGFVNFSPPLDNLNTAATTYLVGCRIIIPFGNRLLAIGTFEATSTQILGSTNTNFLGTYYGNRIRYCEVTSTPFYSNPVPSTLPLPNVEPLAWVSNIQGYGGFIDLDTTERIISAAITQGSLILGLESEQRKLSNTGIETDPFTIQLINPDYGTAGTHSTIPMDKGILTVGEYGFLTTSSFDAERFDLPIIQQVFQINPSSNGYERISGGRDFANEVVYFSYPSIFDPTDANSSIFPDTTLVFNYRENSFSIWYESVTTYGLVKEQQKTWSALTTFTWAQWDLPWNAPATVSTYPFVGFGTPQGFVMLKWYYDSTNDPSIAIQAISTLNPDGTYSITSVNHNLFSGAYVGFFSASGASPSFIGYVAHLGDGNNANPQSIFSVNFDATVTPAMIATINPGTWEVSIVDQPYIQTKQFQFAWSDAKKTRIGAQKYFMDTTDFGEFTVEILGSQSPTPLNTNTVANPQPSVISNAIVRTRPDDSLGINGSQSQQSQIWHRLASSCIGDTVQLQISFSDPQMRSVNIGTSPWKMQALILDLYPSRTLA